jgi:D-threo-aldose 1-dehydrogenase
MKATDLTEIGKTGLKVTRLSFGCTWLGYYQAINNPEGGAEFIQAVLDLGINYLDTAPRYGYGSSEQILGMALANIPRENYIISTKVGYLLRDVNDYTPGRPYSEIPGVDSIPDFSRDGVLRSYESSLSRLKIDHVDIIYIHDPHLVRNYYREVMEGAYPALEELRSQGAIKGIGVGMDDVNMFYRFAKEADFDCFLLWGRCSLLDQSAIFELLPLCKQKGISIVMGAPFESGILASDLKSEARFRYAQASSEVIEKARRIDAVCHQFDVPLKAAALQFVFSSPNVATVIPGTKSFEKMEENRRMLEYSIPSEFWHGLKDEFLLPESIPLPPE